MREAVHWSVLARMKLLAAYLPRNICHDPFWESVFVDGTPTDTDIVGPNERFLNWWVDEADYKAVLNLVPANRIAQFKANAAKYVAHFERQPRPKP